MSLQSLEADKMLDAYIHDYLVKRKFETTANLFKAEASIPPDSSVVDAPSGFLFEWWSVFWDIFIAKTNDKHSEAATSYLETQSAKARLQKQQQLRNQQNLGMQVQQQPFQTDAFKQQQQQRDRGERSQGPVTGRDRLDSLGSKCAASNVMAARTREEICNLLSRDSEYAAMKQGSWNTVSQLLNQNPASVMTADALSGQLLWNTSNATSGASRNLHHLRNLDQRNPVSKRTKSQVNATRYARANTAGSSLRVQGPDQDGNMLTLKGWPLTGLDQLGAPQHYRSMQAPPSLNTILLQPKLLHPVQQYASSSSINSVDPGALRAFLYDRETRGVKDAFYSGGVHGDTASSIPVGIPLVPLGNAKLPQQEKLVQGTDKQLQQDLNPSTWIQRYESYDQIRQQQHKLVQSSSRIDDTVSNSLGGNDQASKGQIWRKRKQTESLQGALSDASTKTAAAPSSSSPLTTSPGKAAPAPNFSQNSGSSSSLPKRGSHGMSTLVEKCEVGLDQKETCDDNVDSFHSHDATDQWVTLNGSDDTSNGIVFSEIQSISASTSQIECCKFSPDGKLLATGGHDKLVKLWCTDSLTTKFVLEEHTEYITSVCFSPSMSKIATSSADKTVRVWDIDNLGYSLRTFVGHSAPVTLVGFYPGRENIVCSCDEDGDMRYWKISNGTCAGLVKGVKRMSFQPHPGRLMATSTGNLVSIIDVETRDTWCKLQGHNSSIHSLSWNSSGNYLASVSDDMVRVWSTRAGSKGICVRELSSSTDKFQTSAFHPTRPSILIIGCHKTLQLWNLPEGKITTVNAHDDLITGLAVSEATGFVASASHDKYVKLWK